MLRQLTFPERHFIAKSGSSIPDSPTLVARTCARAGARPMLSADSDLRPETAMRARTRPLSVILVLAVATLLTACAGSPRVVDDTATVNAVERSARMSGIAVVWVNPPKKRVSESKTTSQ